MLNRGYQQFSKRRREMKKKISLVKVILFGFAFGIAFPGSVNAVNLPFCDGFETYDSGTYPSPTWHVRYSGSYAQISTEDAYSGEKSFKLVGVYNWSRADYVLCDFPDNFCYSFAAMVPPNSKGGMAGIGRSGGANPINGVGLNTHTNRIGWDGPTSPVTLFPECITGKWYNVNVCIKNFSSSSPTADITVSDGTNVQTTKDVPAYNRTQANLNYIQLHTFSQPASSVFFDDVCIEEIPQNRMPIADAGSDQTVEQESYVGTEVTLDGSGSTDPDSTPGTNDDIVSFNWYEGTTLLGTGETLDHTFQLGTHAVTLRVTDSDGETDDDEVIVVVEDTTPPTINSISADPDELWPPNHKMVEVTVSVDAEDICDPEPFCYILGVSCDEPINGPGDGNTEPDWEFTDDPLVVLLRAERAGGGDGRVYTIDVVCEDASGNITTDTVDVIVPHDKGNGKGKGKKK
jgi:hypothetical protein